MHFPTKKLGYFFRKNCKKKLEGGSKEGFVKYQTLHIFDTLNSLMYMIDQAPEYLWVLIGHVRFVQPMLANEMQQFFFQK